MVYDRTTDDYGLTLPNNYLNLYFPAANKSIVLYVKFRRNPGYTLLNYGPLPTTTSSSMINYNGLAGGTGGTGTPGGAGQFPAGSFLKGVQFSVPATFYISGNIPTGNTDIWYTQVATKLFEVAQYVTPNWFRVAVDIPTGQVQQNLQGQVAGGVDQDFGWRRGKYYAVHIPNVHYGYGYGNDVNVAAYTRVVFRYAEQEVAPVKDPSLIFQITNNMIPAHTVEMPINNSEAVRGNLINTYGFDGYPVFPRTKQQEALSTYANLINQLQSPGGAM